MGSILAWATSRTRGAPPTEAAVDAGRALLPAIESLGLDASDVTQILTSRAVDPQQAARCLALQHAAHVEASATLGHLPCVAEWLEASTHTVLLLASTDAERSTGLALLLGPEPGFSLVGWNRGAYRGSRADALAQQVADLGATRPDLLVMPPTMTSFGPRWNARAVVDAESGPFHALLRMLESYHNEDGHVGLAVVGEANDDECITLVFGGDAPLRGHAHTLAAEVAG